MVALSENPPAATPGAALHGTGGTSSARDPSAYVVTGEDGLKRLHLMVDGVHCGGCVRKIERRLGEEGDVRDARVNLTTRRLGICWDGSVSRGADFLKVLGALGFDASPYDPDQLRDSDKKADKQLLTAMGVSGFAAMNVMLMSVAVWAGHSQGMGEATRGMLHWFSALIALPGIAFAGRPFFASAHAALRSGSTNMDVPISVGVILATAMSLHETIVGGEHVYFESALMLLFFLLVGRFLDRRSRAKARSSVERLIAMGRSMVHLRDADGTVREVPADWVQAGDIVQVGQGERIAVDARIVEGRSDVDMSLINGESTPQPVAPGDRVFAGTINLSGPLALTVDRVGEQTLLSEIVRLMEAAEQKRGRFVSLADKVTRLYTPVVHVLAAIAFIGWWGFAGIAWQPAMLIAVAVLIITCPCALGLAVPAVQVTAGTVLMRLGILLKSSTALERLARVDTVVFDKTGTLTDGEPVLQSAPDNRDSLAVATAMARHSRHPLCRALVRYSDASDLQDSGERHAIPADEITECPGDGMVWTDPHGGEYRLGRIGWCGGDAREEAVSGPELWLATPGAAPQRFAFAERLRPDAANAVRALCDAGYEVHLLSGDRRASVEPVAKALGLTSWASDTRPDDKVAFLEKLQAAGKTVVMVGDGLNDAPALAAASASVSLTTAADVTQTAADAVLQGGRLSRVPRLLSIARLAQRLVKQNFAMALAYNAIAVPFAMAGFVTPLIAAAAMSGSSVLVTLNALRLGLGQGPEREADATPAPPAIAATPRTAERAA